MDSNVAETSQDDPENGNKTRLSHRASLEYDSESAGNNLEKRKLLSRSSVDWKDRCWNWCGLTNSDLKIRRRSQIICSVCGLMNIAIILLIFLVNHSFSFLSLFSSDYFFLFSFL
jgi:hypothetical protein